MQIDRSLIERNMNKRAVSKSILLPKMRKRKERRERKLCLENLLKGGGSKRK
jgi:hypothetical protein